MKGKEVALREAAAIAFSLHKSPPAARDRELARRIIPLLAAALDEDAGSEELRALAAAWVDDPSSLGRRARDLAVELAKRVAFLHGWPIPKH